MALKLSGMGALAALAIGGLIAWPFVFSSSYDLRVFTLAGIFAINTLGYQFVFGHAGALALTQGTFFGLGAYIAGLTALEFGWTFAETVLLAVAGPVMMAVIIAAPVLRLQSHYFALATLGIGQVVLLVAIQWEPLTGGANGRPGVPGIELFGAPALRGIWLAAFVWGITAIAALIAWQSMRGLVGRAFAVARENDLAALSIGIDIWRLRWIAFLWSAAYAGLAGALYVRTVKVISPEVLEFHIMVAVLTMAVVGGRTHVAGAVIGAFLLVHLPEWFRGLDRYYLIAYGVVLLMAIVVAPNGLVGLAQDWMGRRRRAKPPAIPVVTRRTTRRTDGREPASLQIENISMAFGGVRALNQVSLRIPPGEIFGLIGPNGSGKSTLINCVSGIYAPQNGRIMLGDRDLMRERPHAIAKLGVTRTFQNLNLIDQMTVQDNVAIARFAATKAHFFRDLYDVRSRRLGQARDEAMQVLERSGIAAYAQVECGGLSYGTKRRVEIARALALAPSLMLLDEPAAGLSSAEQRELADWLQDIRTDGMTLVIVEHNMGFLMPLASRMACLDHGVVITEGTPAQLRAHPQVIAAYLGNEAVIA
ncbi:MAG: branched-chain amino acid ABC transporter ATP-binding protein/permease [Betaproteobacteria bacterium]|nr:branched-chain amino acid ABC transporter ATP-binding protein/permease [Betaproteobacteria bacterium]